MALQYLINMIFGLINCFLFYAFYVTFENQINNIIKHCTIMNIDSKRYVFYNFAWNIESMALNSRMYEWGASFFLMESIAFLLFYFFMFTIIPLHVFKYLNLNASSSSSYFVVKLSEED